MKYLFICGLLLVLAQKGRAQMISHDSLKLSSKSSHLIAITSEIEREFNMYANRKYSYGFTETFYGFQPNTVIFHAIDGNFSERFRGLDIYHRYSFEATGGASFQPYQGFRLHLGFDYEWLAPSKFHPFMGLQFAEGLEQKTFATSGPSYVMVGYHSYIMPFTGLMYWPGMRDIAQVIKMPNLTERAKLRNPTFWQLVYFKLQIGYSILLSNQAVRPSETFDLQTATTIRRNISSGLYLCGGAGINLPSFKHIKLLDLRLQQILDND
jgi:hypothetical protein